MSELVPDYTPPDTATMATRQNTRAALRLLLAQRRLYSKAKRWLALRWFGMLLIGLAAPVISVSDPDLAVAAGAIAGLWLFVGRTLIAHVETGKTAAAAAIQEEFDFLVFGMPTSVPRSIMPPPEDIAKLVGPEDSFDAAIISEKLADWYPFSLDDPGPTAVAIAQRTNAWYSGSLLRSTAKVWAVLTTLWVVGLIVWSAIVDVPLSSFLLGVLLPVLPAALDVVEFIGRVRSASRERNDLAAAIWTSLSGPPGDITAAELLVWQEQLYHLRKTAPPDVPDIIYKLKRPKNEHAMITAARELGTTPPA